MSTPSYITGGRGAPYKPPYGRGTGMPSPTAYGRGSFAPPALAPGSPPGAPSLSYAKPGSGPSPPAAAGSGRGHTPSYTPLFVQKKRDPNHQLPALDISTSSLTDGTSIPRPEPTPPLEQLTQSEGHGHEQDRGQHNQGGQQPAAESPAGSHADARSPPQTPLTLESPNPLRSHPTSTLSLSRKFQQDGQEAGDKGVNGSNGAMSGSATAYAPGTAYVGHQQNGSTAYASYNSQPQNGHAPIPSSKRPANNSSPPGSISAPSGTSTAGKRQVSSENMSPPAKRPLSVRKFLGLRSLSAAFSRSNIDKDSRSSREADRPERSQTSQGMYQQHQRNRSTDLLSMFSRRPESRQSSAPTPGQPQQQQERSLRKRRSSLMLLGRRGSAFFGLNVEEEAEPAEQQHQSGPQGLSQQYQQSFEFEHPLKQSRTRSEQDPDVSMDDASTIEPTEPAKPRTPPPTLPGLESFNASKGLHADDGGFFGNGADMFRDIH